MLQIYMSYTVPRERSTNDRTGEIGRVPLSTVRLSLVVSLLVGVGSDEQRTGEWLAPKEQDV